MNYGNRIRLLVGCVAFLAISVVSAQSEPLTVDKEKKTVVIACKIAPRKLPNLPDIYPVEVIATWSAPKGQKAHETIVTYDVKPSEVHKALESIGLKPGKAVKGQGAEAEGPEVKVFLELPSEAGEPRRIAIEKCLVDRKTGKTLPTLKWRFTGSAMKQPDPAKEEKVYGADLTGTLITVFPVTDDTVLQSSLTMEDEPLIKLDTNKKNLPAEDAPVKLVIQAAEGK